MILTGKETLTVNYRNNTTDIFIPRFKEISLSLPILAPTVKASEFIVSKSINRNDI